MHIHICVRQTLAWQDEALVRAHINPRFRQKFETWNETFTMPYHLFRVHLREIAADNLRRVAGTVVSDISRVPEGDIVVPIDDDDWLAPDLAARITPHLNAAAVLIVWERLALERTPWLRSARRWAGRALRRPDYPCKTNNYAVRWRHDRLDITLNHVRASEHAGAHPSDVAKIGGTLAIQNRSLASQTTLAWKRPAIRRAELIQLFHAHRTIYARWRPSPTLEWATPYVARMNDLMARVSVK